MAQPFSQVAGRSFSAEILRRILSVLHQEGPTKKTNLAGKTRLNYLTCLKYLELLKSLGLVDLMKGDTVHDGEHISINHLGLRFNAGLLAFLEGSHGNGMMPDSPVNLSLSEKNNLQKSPLELDENANKVRSNVQTKIMLVDDEQDILFTYKLFLSGRGYDTEEFSNPVEALNHFALSPTSYGLVISDIRMSSLNGLQLFHGIKALNPDIRFIFCSALDARDELVSVLPGMQRKFVLKKPVDKKMFMEAVNSAFQDGSISASIVSPFVSS